jgi:small neutral amino acid transporter SnatA (MarC family)
MIARRVLRAGVALALILIASFAVAAPPENCPSVTAAELRQSAQAGVDWFTRNQDPDGTWLYLYNAADDSTSPEYNEVRHAGVTMGLYQAAAAGMQGAARSADRGTQWALDNLVKYDGWSAFAGTGEVTTGATALLAAGLTYRREATGDSQYDRLMGRLGRFLIAQTEPSGAVSATYSEAEHEPVAGDYSKYFTGEAYWALARLHRAFPGQGWGEAADLIGGYLAKSRDDVEDHWPAVPDHWAAYGASETVQFPERGDPPLTEDELDYARRQAGLFGVGVRWVAQQAGPWGEVVRGSDTPRGGGYGVMSEALTGWWLTALADERLSGLREPVADRAMCVAGHAVDAQSDAEDAAGAAQPARVEGAWFHDGVTRMDDQQHALAGLLRTIPIAERVGGTRDPGDDAPSGWLWAIVLVLALNPARAAFAVPRAHRTPRETLEVCATGGAIGGLAVVATAALADPLLDALDVSDPSFRVAAGIVAGLAGVSDLFRRPPQPEPALPGRRAALVPVAIPAVARPALFVAAIGAGADHGVLVSFGAMAAGVALLTGLVAGLPADGPRGRVLLWASRLLAAGLVAGGVILTVDGITDV